MVHKPYIETLPHRKVDVSLCQALMNCSSTCFVVDECERRGVSRWRCLPQLSPAHLSNTFREATLSFNPTDMNHLLHEFLSSPQILLPILWQKQQCRQGGQVAERHTRVAETVWSIKPHRRRCQGERIEGKTFYVWRRPARAANVVYETRCMKPPRCHSRSWHSSPERDFSGFVTCHSSSRDMFAFKTTAQEETKDDHENNIRHLVYQRRCPSCNISLQPSITLVAMRKSESVSHDSRCNLHVS